MYWEDVIRDSDHGEWDGIIVRLKEAKHHPPSLHAQATSKRLMRIAFAQQGLLWSRIAEDYEGYAYLISSHSWRNSPGIIPPIPISEIDARERVSPDLRLPSWARYFTKQLFETGAARLTRRDVFMSAAACFRNHGGNPPDSRTRVPIAAHWNQIIEQPQRGYCRWDFDKNLPPLSLRAPGRLDRERLTTWRKLARNQQLPPVVLWWVSGLDRYVIIDGVHRAVAALEEGFVPRCLALVPWEQAERSTAGISAWHNLADAVQRALANSAPPKAFDGVLNSERPHIGLDPYTGCERTGLYNTAWPIPGGPETWKDEVQSELTTLERSSCDILAEFSI